MMKISDDFKIIVDEDIERCRNAIKNSGKMDLRYLYRSLLSKYTPIISDFDGHFSAFHMMNLAKILEKTLELLKKN